MTSRYIALSVMVATAPCSRSQLNALAAASAWAVPVLIIIRTCSRRLTSSCMACSLCLQFWSGGEGGGVGWGPGLGGERDQSGRGWWKHAHQLLWGISLTVCLQGLVRGECIKRGAEGGGGGGGRGWWMHAHQLLLSLLPASAGSLIAAWCAHKCMNCLAYKVRAAARVLHAALELLCMNCCHHWN